MVHSLAVGKLQFRMKSVCGDHLWVLDMVVLIEILVQYTCTVTLYSVHYTCTYRIRYRASSYMLLYMYQFFMV